MGKLGNVGEEDMGLKDVSLEEKPGMSLSWGVVADMLGQLGMKKKKKCHI